MSQESYPTLGFDPAPGRLESVDDLTAKLTKAATGLERAHTTLIQIGHGGKTWEGEAANAFARKVGDLPKYVSDSHQALRSAATQLGTWHAKLAEYQRRGIQYEAEAKRAKGEETARAAAHDRATSAYNQAAADPDLRLAGQLFANQAQLDSAQARIDAASGRLNQAAGQLDQATADLDNARDELEAILKRAKELLETHQSDARDIASRLEKANEKAPDPGFWEGLADTFTKLGHDIQNWCTKHADTLKTVGDWLSIGSAVLGALSLLTLWCPPLSGALALGAGALSLGALGAHGAAKLGGANVSATDLAMDGLGVIPFGKFGTTLIKGSSKVAIGTTTIGEAVVTRVDDVQKIGRLNRLPSAVAHGEDIALHAANGGGRLFESAGGFGNRTKLAWESHLADNLGSSFKEKRISDLLTGTHSPLRHMESLKSAVRADGSLDPMSWWSKGPQLAGSVPGTVHAIYDKATGSE
ncbi:putative T7SS-secreted protein [Streptomyces sp. NPDC051569]|uniref:putative T7SS-secreted protein n=1 Tax=Streptomyces sp. NPDC051569 TaxID=3365661 RepID=UPI0037B9E1C1